MNEIKSVFGQDFEIVLDSKPTAGYKWHPHYDENALQQVSRRVIRESNPMMVGGAAKEQFVFKPLRAGITTEIRMAYKRPWEGETHYEKEEIFRVNIT